MMSKLTLLGLWICMSLNTYCQSARLLTLENAITLAQEQSPRIAITSKSFLAASYDFLALQARYRPQLFLRGNIPGLTRRIQNQVLDDGSQDFITQSQSFSSLRLNINQSIPYTGGDVEIESSIFNIRNFEPFDRTSWQTTPFLLTITQPLFQPNVYKWDIRERNLEFDVAQIRYARSLEDVALEITNIYFNALRAQLELQRAQFNVANNDTIYTISQGRFNVGKIAENELLQSELNLRNAQIAEQRADLDYQRAIQQLKTVLGFDRNQELSVEIPSNFPTWEVEPDFAVSQALLYSQEMIQADLDLFQADQEVEFTRKRNGLNADLTASVGLNNTAEEIGDLLNDLQDRQFVTVGLSIPIFRWGQGKAELNAALARQQSTREEQKLIRQQLADEVYFRVQNLQQLRTQVDISARSDTISQRGYDIAKNRYLIGKIDIQNLFQFQRDKDAAQNDYVRSLEGYWIALQELRSVTLYDFEKMEPIRPEPPIEIN